MKKLLMFSFSLFMLMDQAIAQDIIPLYGSKIPGAKVAPADYKETVVAGTDGVLRVGKVTDPSLTVYLPVKGKANGTAVIICPGGGYSILAFDKEGTKVAEKFTEIGVTAFVLKYRLPSELIMDDKSTGPLQDAQQAIYLVRKNAANWKLDVHKIGVMGFSAGGHLAASLTVHFNDRKIENQENINLRPDFSVLIYPVISFGAVTHAGSVKNLVGSNPTEAQTTYFSNENHVDEHTPPTFLVHANNDLAVPVKNSILFNEALVKFNVPAEMHIYQSGGHGFGLKGTWFEMLKNWMDANKFLN